MSDWKAVTQSGTEYLFHEGILIITDKYGYAHAIKPLIFKSSEHPSTLPGYEGDKDWRDVERPVIGERFYAGAFRDWRISTMMVTVEDL